MFPCLHNGTNRSFAQKRCMDRPLALGGAGGVVSSLVIGLLRGINQVSHEVDLSVAAEAFASNCVDFPSLDNLPWWFFGAGFLVGICFGPFIDLCWLARQRWRRLIWSQVIGNSPGAHSIPKPLFKVLG